MAICVKDFKTYKDLYFGIKRMQYPSITIYHICPLSNSRGDTRKYHDLGRGVEETPLSHYRVP